MRKLTLVLTGGMILIVLLSTAAHSATSCILTGRILQQDGFPLVNSALVINGRNLRTNGFGGYEVELENQRDLRFRVNIGGTEYTSEPITLVCPRTMQNWKMDLSNRTLLKSR